MSDEVIKTRYVIYSRVTKIDERFARRIVSSSNERGLQTQDVSLGWFINFEGSHESLYFGDQRPRLDIGDNVKITIEKV